MFQSYKVIEGVNRKTGEVEYRDVPTLYGDMTRHAAYIIRNNSENMISSVPRMSYYITGLESNSDMRRAPGYQDIVQVVEKKFDEMTQTYLNEPGRRYSVKRTQPVPYVMTVSLDIWTSVNAPEQKMQLIEQILALFNPGVNLRTNTNPLDWTSLTYCELRGVNFTGRSIPQGADDAIDVATLDFWMPIFISPPAEVKRQNVIDTIIANMHASPQANTIGRPIDELFEESDSAAFMDRGKVYLLLSDPGIDGLGVNDIVKFVYADEKKTKGAWEPIFDADGASALADQYASYSPNPRVQYHWNGKKWRAVPVIDTQSWTVRDHDGKLRQPDAGSEVVTLNSYRIRVWEADSGKCYVHLFDETGEPLGDEREISIVKVESDVATFTTNVPHGYEVGSKARFSGFETGSSGDGETALVELVRTGTHTITAVAGSTFTIAATGVSNVIKGGASGTVMVEEDGVPVFSNYNANTISDAVDERFNPSVQTLDSMDREKVYLLTADIPLPSDDAEILESKQYKGFYWSADAIPGKNDVIKYNPGGARGRWETIFDASGTNGSKNQFASYSGNPDKQWQWHWNGKEWKWTLVHTPIDWKAAVFDRYGELRPDISQLRLKSSLDAQEIIGTVDWHYADADREKPVTRLLEVVFNMDTSHAENIEHGDDIVSSAVAFVDPNTMEGAAALLAATDNSSVFILLNDMPDSIEWDGKEWDEKTKTYNMETAPKKNDIIRWKEKVESKNVWETVFDSSDPESQTDKFITVHDRGKWHWTGSARNPANRIWQHSVLGVYKPGFWRIAI